MDWKLRDCNLSGGGIMVGPPSLYAAPKNYIYGEGAIEWFNNLFDRVGVVLRPTYWSEAGGAVNVDLALTAYNNLFRNQDFLLDPIPATAGDWLFKDNLFDKAGFAFFAAGVLDHGYNAYWQRVPGELGPEQVARLQPNSGNDVLLTVAPPYVSGPFGPHYINYSSNPLPELYQTAKRGSRTPAAAGLFHGTTRLDQTKDGSQSGNVIIGRHYVAAVNSYTPQAKGTDSDGIADYVEDANGNGQWDQDLETKINAVYTTTGIHDSLNAVYDDVDLDGDGLVGRVEMLLGTAPLVLGNPLALTPVTLGEEPHVLAFSVSLGEDITALGADLSLMFGDQPASGYEIEHQSNGTFIVRWNSTFSEWGDSYLQLRLHSGGITLPQNVGESPANIFAGPIYPVRVKNIVRFKPFYSSFSNQLWVHGTLGVPEANYQIRIYDTQDNLLKTLTGATSSGLIDHAWDLRITPGGPQRQDAEFRTEVVITPLNCDQNLWYNCSIPYPQRFFRSLSWSGDAFTMGYGWDDYWWADTRQEMIRENVVDVVFDPSLDNEYQNTLLNSFHGQAFRMHTTLDASVLLDDIAASGVRNFFWSGHGSSTGISAGVEDGGSLAPADVAIALGNMHGRFGWNQLNHPYRLVILNSCEGAKSDAFVRAFGIEPSTVSAADIVRRPEAEQAFVGWSVEIDYPGGTLGPNSPTLMNQYGASLWVLFTLWMQEYPLSDCLNWACNPELDFPLDTRYVVYGYSGIRRTPQ